MYQALRTTPTKVGNQGVDFDMVKNYDKLSWQQLNLPARCFFETEEDVDKRDISTMVDSQPKYQQVLLADC